MVLGRNICNKGKGKEHRLWSSVSGPDAGYLGCIAMEKLMVKVERRRVLLYKCIIEVASSRTQLPDKWLMQLQLGRTIKL